MVWKCQGSIILGCGCKDIRIRKLEFVIVKIIKKTTFEWEHNISSWTFQAQ